jgi:hypothetical protein
MNSSAFPDCLEEKRMLVHGARCGSGGGLERVVAGLD